MIKQLVYFMSFLACLFLQAIYSIGGMVVFSVFAGLSAASFLTTVAVPHIYQDGLSQVFALTFAIPFTSFLILSCWYICSLVARGIKSTNENIDAIFSKMVAPLEKKKTGAPAPASD